MEELYKFYKIEELPASHVVWEKLKVNKNDTTRINFDFFGARDFPILGFYKSITKSLSLDEMEKKI